MLYITAPLSTFCTISKTYKFNKYFAQPILYIGLLFFLTPCIVSIKFIIHIEWQTTISGVHKLKTQHQLNINFSFKFVTLIINNDNNLFRIQFYSFIYNVRRPHLIKMYTH